MSEQMAHMAPQSQGKSDKGDRLGGLKLLGAFRRMSKQLEPSSRSPSRQGEPLQEAPQRQQYPPQQGQQPPPSSPPPLKQQPQPQQRLVQPAVRSSPLQVGAVSQHGMASPPPGPLGQPLGSSSGAKRQDMGQEEPLYDQVPIPRGYGAVHGEGLVAPTAYDTRRHPLPGHYGQPPRRAPYIAPTGQPGPLRHDSVSSVGMGPRSPRPGSVEEGGAKTGLGVIMAHQPSINSLSTWQGSRLDEREAMESQAGLVLPTSAGHGRLRSHGHSDPASSASTAAGAASRHSQSPTTPTASHPSAAGSANKTAEAVTEDGQVKRHLGEDGSGRRGSPSRNGEVADASRQRSASELRTARGDGARTQEAKKSAEREGPAVELDDTADRYARSRRLESQEEKILYRPEEADDYQPQMSATSYPGQEWNPYGEMGFGEWKED
ncbi:hypothetical protein CDD83_8079 [Cordyceps sp. RAO-2017]|nr:hypothetical protein CDD83_8079 [Cordyceps sp. RAO-2017]